MPNARDITAGEPHRFFLYGPQGAGKTSQILTLPRPCYTYVFDPNSLLTLRGHDIDFGVYLPDDLTLDVVSLKKKDNVHIRGPRVMTDNKATAYEEWEKDFDAKQKARFFDKYLSIAIDSGTMFLDVIMDYVLQINGRPGQWPEQDDYGPQMVTFTNCMRTFASMGKTLLVTGHYEEWQDRKTMRTSRQLMMTGRLRTKIPLLFSDIFYCDAEADTNGNVNYTIQTVKDKDIPAARCSFMPRLAPIENVTLDLEGNLEEQGLGALLMNEQDYLNQQRRPAAKPASQARR